MPTCITCNHFTLRDHPGTSDDFARKAANRLATKSGFGGCLKGTAWHFLSPLHERQCRKHQPADEAVSAQRKAWLAER